MKPLGINMRKIQGIMLLLNLLAIACTDDGGGTAKRPPGRIFARWNGETAHIKTWKNLCTKLSVSFYGRYDNPVAIQQNTLINMQAENGTLHLDDGCYSSPVKQIKLTTGTKQLTIYYQGFGTDDDSITLTSDYFNTISLPVTFTKPKFDLVIGQENFEVNDLIIPATNTSLNQPTGLAIFEKHLIITDRGNNRIAFLDISNIPPNKSFSNIVENITAPTGITTANDRLYIASSNSNQIQVWNNVPLIVNSEFDQALEQDLKTPLFIHGYEDSFLAVDSGNNRILIWNSIPTSNIDFFDTEISNNLSSPSDAIYFNKQYLVVDTENNRVIIYNIDLQPKIVIGQKSFLTNGADISETNLNSPRSIAIDKRGRLYISDTNNHRVLIWNSIPNTNGKAADIIIGAEDFYSSTASVGMSELNFPSGLLIDDEQNLWIADTGNHRIVKLTIP